MWMFLFITPALTQNNAVPFLNQPLVPVSVHPGHSSFTLKVTGTGFASAATVNWNGSPRSTTFISSSKLQATITAADVAHYGTANVTVVNPAPGGGASNVVYFPIGWPRPAVVFARYDTLLSPPGGNNSTFEGLVVGDFNNDGKPDLALGWSYVGAGEIDILLGNGDGTFQSPVATAIPFEFNNLVAGDFNGDGNLDLAIAQPMVGGGGGCPTPYLYAYLGTGDGHLNVAPGGGVVVGWPLATADFNGDGYLDLVTTSTDYGCINWYPAVNLGNGDGSFGSPTELATLQSSSSPAIGDFNRDGNLDVAFPSTNYGNFGVDVFLGMGDGTFRKPLFSSTAYNVTSAAAADLDFNGRLDIVTDGVDVLQGKGNGTFTDVPSQFIGGSNVHLAALSNKQRLDGVLFSQDEINTLLGSGNNSFQAPESWWSGTGEDPAYFGIADFYGDGRLGFAAVDLDALSGLPVLSIFRQTTLGVSPTFMNFGGVKVGQSGTPQTATLTNIGNVAAPLTIQITKEPKNYTQTNNCGTSLPAGDTCTIQVTFSPHAKGVITSEVKVKMTGVAGGPQYIELWGSGQ